MHEQHHHSHHGRWATGSDTKYGSRDHAVPNRFAFDLMLRCPSEPSSFSRSPHITIAKKRKTTQDDDGLFDDMLGLATFDEDETDDEEQVLWQDLDEVEEDSDLEWESDAEDDVDDSEGPYYREYKLPLCAFNCFDCIAAPTALLH